MIHGAQFDIKIDGLGAVDGREVQGGGDMCILMSDSC